MAWRKLAVHKHLQNCSISEMYNPDTKERRFVATIHGFHAWKLGDDWAIALKRAGSIRTRIEEADERVFYDYEDNSDY